jgi:hypothetical protein
MTKPSFEPFRPRKKIAAPPAVIEQPTEPQDPIQHEEPTEPQGPLPQDEDVTLLRAEAARFAAVACARAMRRSLAHYPRLIERFVDDALRACGRPKQAVLRLHPEDVAHAKAQDGIEIIADARIERGACEVKTKDGRLGATIEQRAILLSMAAADSA